MKSSLLVLFSILACVTACSPTEPDITPEPNRRQLTPIEASLVGVSNTFGFGFFDEVIAQSDGGNVFVSPLSVSMALGMTFNGARNATADGMRVALELGDLTVEEINEGYRGLLDLLLQLDPKVAMEIGNSIWYRLGFEVLSEFIEANETYFDAEVEGLDFSSATAADTINAWVEEKTHGKIPAIVDNPIDPNTIMFLIDAIYFKGTWTAQFDPDHTTDQSFATPTGPKSVKLMYQHREDFLCTENDLYQAVELPYGDGLFGMTVLLPKEGSDVDELAASLSSDAFATLQASLVSREGDLYLPRFELEWEDSLKEVLEALGMAVAFTDDADFTGINAAGGLLISNVKHKSYVKVNEEGTEAAAVTSVEVGVTSAAPDYFHMRVDRPFLFVIHDNHSQAMLFMGKIVNPPSE